jgi:ATP citrate (pro-S)-lyase
MLFGKRGKSGLVALNLDLAEVAGFVKERLGKEVPFLLSPPKS